MIFYSFPLSLLSLCLSSSVPNRPFSAFIPSRPQSQVKYFFLLSLCLSPYISVSLFLSCLIFSSVLCKNDHLVLFFLVDLTHRYNIFFSISLSLSLYLCISFSLLSHFLSCLIFSSVLCQNYHLVLSFLVDLTHRYDLSIFLSLSL